jgi:voltage-gated potassium channel
MMYDKKQIWSVLEEADKHNRFGAALKKFLIVLILLNVAAFILETDKSLMREYGEHFHYFDLFSVLIFTLEYLARLYSAPVSPKFSGPFGRLKYVVSPMGLVDLLAILPFYLSFFAFDGRVLRLLRVLRIIRVMKSVRYFSALSRIVDVTKHKSEELLSSLVIILCLMIFTSTIIYYAEHEAQPEAFSSIIASMWWSVATLTTVGYGDIYPITPIGKLFGAISAIFGVGLFAIPAGIIASGFSETREDPVCSVCKNKLSPEVQGSPES